MQKIKTEALKHNSFLSMYTEGNFNHPIWKISTFTTSIKLKFLYYSCFVWAHVVIVIFNAYRSYFGITKQKKIYLCWITAFRTKKLKFSLFTLFWKHKNGKINKNFESIVCPKLPASIILWRGKLHLYQNEALAQCLFVKVSYLQLHTKTPEK